MKWFQLDSNMPDDPKIRAVLARFGNEGLGMLLRLWCYVAAHGTRKPGWSLDSRGKPIDKAAMVEATGAPEEKFDDLLKVCARFGHIKHFEWEKRGVVAFPAMSRRADSYTQRRVRTNFEQGSNKVHVQDSTVQDSTKNKTPLPPFSKGGRLTRKQLKAAQDRRARVYGGCPHSPRCASFTACVEALAREAAKGTNAQEHHREPRRAALSSNRRA